MPVGLHIHSFIMSISIVPLQGDYSGALHIPVQPKRKVHFLHILSDQPCKWFVLRKANLHKADSYHWRQKARL